MMSQKQFIGSEAQTTYADAEAVILPIPYEQTTTYRKGCEHGPDAILEASDQLEAYDIELEQETCTRTKIFTHKAIADNKFVIALGGEHSITAGVVKAYRQTISEPFTVVQIDAHGDMRHSYENSMYNHACVMRRVLDLGLPTLPVGIRSICLEEARLIKEQKIVVIWAKDIYRNSNWINTALEQIKTKKVFVTIDLDGIDPGLMPGVGTPEPGGLNWYELIKFLKTLFLKHQVIGCDVMELAPLSDSVVSEFTAAKLVYKLTGYHNLR